MKRLALSLALLLAASVAQAQSPVERDCDNGYASPECDKIPDSAVDPLRYLKWRWEQVAEDRDRDARVIKSERESFERDTDKMLTLEKAIQNITRR